MTPAAPTATWRKVCEEYFSRLIEDLEQQVESEVESRVAAAIESTVRGAVVDATAESRRALAEELNQAVRRLRHAASVDDLYSILLDVTVSFSEQAAVFSIHQKLARAERMRRPADVQAGDDGAAASLPALEFQVSEAAAFSTAIDTRDPVIAMSTPGEISAALVGLFGHQPDERVFLFPLLAGETVVALFYAAGGVQPPPLELLSEVAALQMQALTTVSAPAVPAAVSVETMAAPEPRALESLVTISAGSLKQPEAVGASPRAQQDGGPRQHKEWWNLSRTEQQMHLAAQRFARVRVAEMRLGTPDAIRSGRAGRDIYAALKQPIDVAREKFREKHMTASPTMVDYLHLELVRSLADDDAILLGPDYPGPLV